MIVIALNFAAYCQLCHNSMQIFTVLDKNLQGISFRNRSHPAEVRRSDLAGGRGAGVGQSGVNTRARLLSQHVVAG